jgi:branched-chain amino acid transport system substrate-binding protein
VSIVSRSYALAALGGFAAAGGAGRSALAQTAKTYTFGALLPLTGFAAEIGQEQSQGMQAGVDAVNARGGVAGWTLKAIPLDHKGTAAGGVQAFNQLVNLEKVPYALMGFAAVILATYPTAVQNQVLVLNIGGISTNLLDKPWLYNNQLIGEPLNVPLAQYAREHGIRTAAILVGEDPLGRDNSAIFSAAFVKRGGTIAASETFPIGATDFSVQLSKIRAANPDAIFNIVAGDTQGLILKQARAAGYRGAFLGLGQPNLAQLAGDAAEGFISAGLAEDWGSTNRNVRQLFTSYKNKFGKQPSWIGGTVYEGVLLLAKLIDSVARSGKDPRSGAALQAALEASPSFPNCLSGGQVVFRKDHGCTRAVALSELRGGKWVTVRVITPAAS